MSGVLFKFTFTSNASSLRNDPEEEEQRRSGFPRLRIPDDLLPSRCAADSDSVHPQYLLPPLQRRGRSSPDIPMLHYVPSPSSLISSQDQDQSTTVKRSDQKPPPTVTSGQQQNPRINKYVPENVATSGVRCLNTHINTHENDDTSGRNETSCTEISLISRRQKGPNTYLVPKDRKVIRKKLSGFFKKTAEPTEISMSRKSILSTRAPVLEADYSSTDGELDLHFDSINTSIHGKFSINDGTYTRLSQDQIHHQTVRGLTSPPTPQLQT